MDGARPGPLRTYDRGVARLARAAASLSRLVGAGAGSSIPGLLLQRLDPDYASRRAAQLPSGVILVSGTNGKTTTTAMLRTILLAEGLRTISNETGANLFRGVAAALAYAPPNAEAAVFEVDEGALTRVVPALRPRVLVLTNVFRDQLDRFGEPETVAQLLARAAQTLPPGARVVANADDPMVWHHVSGSSPIGFAVVPPPQPDHERPEAEPETCPRCGAPLRYEVRTIAHLGRAHCTSCSWRSAEPDHRAVLLEPPTLTSTRVEVAGVELDLRASGLHNAYNAAAAIAACASMGIPPERGARALRAFRPRFGRAEEFQVSDRTLWLALMKNPAGASPLIEQVAHDPRVGSVLVSVSDDWMDGRDISWIWDANFEALARLSVPLVAGGRRAADVAVRLKYAGRAPAAVSSDPREAMSEATRLAPEGTLVAALTTYTAMLDARRALLRSRRAWVSDQAA